MDFEYEVDGQVYQFSMEGGTSIMLSDLVKVLNILNGTSFANTEAFLSEIDNVIFSNPELVKVTQLEGDWVLESLRAFSSVERLVITMKNGDVVVVKVTDAQTITNLTNAIESAVINGKAPGQTVDLKVGDKYTVNLVFKETDDYQFNMAAPLTYKLPDGLKIPGAPVEGIIEDEDPDSRKIYAIHYTIDANGNIIYEWIVRDQAKFDELLVNSERTFIKQNIEVEYDGASDELIWTTELITDVNADRTHDAKVSKSSEWDPKTQKIKYTVKVESDGISENIKIQDTISGTALTFDKNVTTTSTINHTVTNTSDNNGFTVDIPKMSGGESIEFHYTASVNLDTLLAGGAENGKYGDVTTTGNSVQITSVTGDDGNPGNNSAETYNNHDISISSVEKNGVASKEVVDGKRRVTWTVILNKEQLKNLAGSPFTDTINADSVSMVSYSGPGITVQRMVQDQWGNLVNAGDSFDVAWGTNGLSNPVSSGDKSFTYTFPTGDTGTNYAYKITYTTDVDVSNIIADTEIKNDGTTPYGEGTGKSSVGPTDENRVDLSKTVSSVDITTKTIEWDVTFQVPASGLDSAIVTDTLPYLQFYDGETNPNDFSYYYDVVDSYTVTGLLDGEDYSVSYQEVEHYSKDGLKQKIDKTGIVFTFTKNGQPGLFGGKEARTVTVHLVTTIPDEWLEAVTNENVTRSVHQNIARIDANGKSVTKDASVDLNPTEPELVKRLESQAPKKSGENYSVFKGNWGNENGVEAFGYRIFIYGLTDDAFVDGKLIITDTFPGQYLEYTDTTGKGNFSDNRVVVTDGNIYNHQGVFSYSDIIGRMDKHVDHDQEISDVVVDGNTIIFTINKEDVPTNGGQYYPEYSVGYFLNIKSAKVRQQMNEDAKAAGGILKLNNIASSANLGDSEVIVDWEVPVLSKSKTKNLEKNNTYTFTISVNPEGDQLGSGETLTLSDTVTNLSVDYNSITVNPEDAIVAYDYSGNTITFTVLNATPITITYDATVIKSGQFKNVVVMNGQEATEGGTESVSHGGSSGYEKTPTLRVKKYEKGNMLNVLPGAVFEVYPFDSTKPGNYDASQQPIDTYTTDGDGSFTISKKNSILFDTKYVLHEVTPPPGYKLTHDYYFTISSGAADYGDYIYFQNDVMPVDEQPEDETETSISVNKVWQNAEGQDITAQMTRPVTVRLYKMAEGSTKKSDAIEVSSYTLKPGDAVNGVWKHTFEHLEAGNTYFVAEDAVPGYAATYSTNNTIGLKKSGSIDITNKEKDKPETTDIEVLKVWQNPEGGDAAVKDDVESIRVQLKRKIKSGTLVRVGTGWDATSLNNDLTFGIPKVQAGSIVVVNADRNLNGAIGTMANPSSIRWANNTWPFEYTVPEGYNDEDLIFLTNGGDIKAYTFTVHNAADATFVDDTEFNKSSANSYVLSEQNNWSFVRTNLPLSENGNTYQYYVEEMEVTYTDHRTETIVDQFDVKYKVGNGEYADIPDSAIVTSTTGTITVANRYEEQKGSISVTKTDVKDVDTNASIDADNSFTFVIKDSSGNQVGEALTVKKGQTASISNLPFGTYTVEELTTGRDIDGYEFKRVDLNSSEVTINATTPSVTVTATNYYDKDEKLITIPDSVTVNKLDETNTALNGAVFTLYKDNTDGALSTEVATFTGNSFEISTENTAISSYLPAENNGTVTLYLKETTAPSGYILDNTIHNVLILTTITGPIYDSTEKKFVTTTTYTMTIDGVETKDIVNTPDTDVGRVDSQVTVSKTDGNNNALAGAVFGLYDGTTKIKEFGGTGISHFDISTSDEDLAAYLPAVGSNRTLTLKEESAPAGYDKSKTEYSVVLSTSAETDWNTDHSKKVTTTTYSISINNNSSLTVPNPELPGSLKLKKNVTVNESDPTTLTNNLKCLADGTYTFTIESKTLDPKVTKTVTITFENGSIKEAKVAGEAVETETGWVVVSDLPADTYTVTEEKPDNGTSLVSGITNPQNVVVSKGNIDGVKTAEFTNNIDTGDLSLTKTVSGKTDTTTQFEFEIQLTLPEGVTRASAYPAKHTGDNSVNSVAVSDEGKITGIKLKHDEKLTINDLPAGTSYVITEIGTYTGFTQGEKTNLTGTILAKETIDASVNNVFAADGDVIFEATKNFLNGDLKDKQFTFKLTQIAAIPEGEAEAVAATDNVKLHSPEEKQTSLTEGTSQTVTFSPVSFNQDDIGKTYYFMIEEEIPEDVDANNVSSTDHVKYDTTKHYFKVEVAEENGDLTITKTASVTGDAYTEAKFTNEQLGKLTVTKTFDGAAADLLTDEQKNAVTFTIDGPEGFTKIEDKPLSDFTKGENGVYSLTLDNIPIGEYSVTESNAEIAGYICTTTYLVDEKEATESKATITKDGSIISFTNTYEFTELTIRKAMEKGTSTEPFEFTVEVKDKQDNSYTGKAFLLTTTPAETGGAEETQSYTEIDFQEGKYTATVQAGSSVTICGIPADYTYTVSEVNKPGFLLVSVDSVTTKTESTGTISGDESVAAFVNREVVDISASKEWQDKDGNKLTGDQIPTGAEVTFTLLANNKASDPVRTVVLNGVDETKRTVTPDSETAEAVKPENDDYEGADWTAYFTNLPKYDESGETITYSVQETGKWSGFEVVGQDTCENAGSIINKEQSVTLEIEKVDQNERNKKLGGAVFQLQQLDETQAGARDKDHGISMPSAATDETTGRTSFSGLTTGFYKISEMEAPKGYVLASDATFFIKVLDGEITFIDKDDSKTPDQWNNASNGNLITYVLAVEKTDTTEATNACAKVGNTPGTALPQTGGIGTTLFTALGGLMTATAGAILTMKSYRRRKQNA